MMPNYSGSSVSELLRFEHLSRIDPLSGKVLFEPVSHRIYSGDKIVLSGPSGSGKSVFMRCLASLDPPSTGQIYFKDELLTPHNCQAYRTQVAYVRQHATLEEGTVLENIRLPYTLKINQSKTFNHEQLVQYLRQLNKSESFLVANTTTLSGGEQQLCCFLRVLMLEPTLLLLDEPSSALDIDSVQLLEALLRSWIAQRPDSAWVWISHDEKQKQLMGNIYWWISQGRMRFDSPGNTQRALSVEGV